MNAASSAEANAAYRAGLCVDCRVEPYSPGRTRCYRCFTTYSQSIYQPPEVTS